MILERKSPAREGRAETVHFAGEHSASSKIGIQRQPNKRAHPGSPAVPYVTVTRRNGSAFVVMVNRPWGWPNADREFLNPASPAVDRYAERLRRQIATAAQREAARLERVRQAKRRERDFHREQAERGLR